MKSKIAVILLAVFLCLTTGCNNASHIAQTPDPISSSDSNGERFLCCYGERNDIFEKFTECAVGDDYIDAALFFAERIKQDAERFREEVEKLDIPVTVITQADCIPDHYKNDINGKIIAINPAILKPEYQRADRQLYYVTGGFGASANSRGSAVFCKNLYDGKITRYERMDVLGEVKPERMMRTAKPSSQKTMNDKEVSADGTKIRLHFGAV